MNIMFLITLHIYTINKEVKSWSFLILKIMYVVYMYYRKWGLLETKTLALKLLGL